jgi:rhodanese-related sulfurtransferase
MSAPEIKAVDAAARIKSGGVVVIDVRDVAEVGRAGLHGAVNIPLDQLPARMNEVPRDRGVMTLCHHGVRSNRAAEFLLANGFDDVVSVAGGIDAWSMQVDPTIPRY